MGGLLFGWMVRKLRAYARGPLQGGAEEGQSGGEDGREDEAEPAGLEPELAKNLDELKKTFGDTSDLKIHGFRFGPEARISGALIFIDGLVNSLLLTEAVLRPLKDWTPGEGEELPSGDNLSRELARLVLCAGEIEEAATLEDVVSGCLSGDAALLLDGCAKGLIISSKGWDKRGVEEPQSETVVRGPREGFTENLRTNTALIRRKIKSGQLRAEHMTLGRRTRTQVCIMYIKDIASPQVVRALRHRLDSLDVDSILESGYIEEYIEDAPFSPFATVGSTEKPDVVAGRLLEGRVAVVVDGTPFVLTVPMLFIESFQTAEDYYVRPLYASIVRSLRFIAFFITIFGPGIYIALTAFHQEFIPTSLLLSIANAREGAPFPVLIETLIMVFAFEILQEAGIRMPRPVGQAISIVGSLLMGAAAVSAGLVGAPVVITVAFTAVSGFLVPTQREASSLLRVVMMLLGGSLGWYGISMGLLALLLHLGSLKSFGVVYFDGFTRARNLQDSVVRMPLWSMLLRPDQLAQGDKTRRGRFFIPPPPPKDPQEQDGEEGEE